MANTDKIVFAEDEVTIHIALGEPSNMDGNLVYPIESKILLPGETVEFDKLPKYLQEKVTAKKAPGLTLLTAKQAEEKLEERDRILGLLNKDRDTNLSTADSVV